MIVNHYPDRAAWLAARRETIGSSDAPIIMGLGFRGGAASKSLYELWAEKTGKLEPQELNSFRLRTGHYMEEGLREELGMALPLDLIVAEPAIFWETEDGAIPMLVDGFRSCTPDSAVCELGGHDARGPGELKTVELVAADDWSEAEASEYALVQVHHQMGTWGKVEGWIGAAIGFGTFWHYHIPRNDDLLGEIWEAEEKFWQLVQRDIPPEVDASESCKRTLRLLHPKDNGETVRIPIAEWDAARYAKLVEDCKLFELSRSVMENALRGKMGDATCCEVMDGDKIAARFSWKHQTRAGYNVNPSETRVLRALKVK